MQGLSIQGNKGEKVLIWHVISQLNSFQVKL